MINIKICDTAPQGACSYYRGIGVFSKLKYLSDKIHVSMLPSVAWPYLVDTDILFYARPFDDSAIEILKMAKNFGVTTWIDYDDCMHSLLDDNPHKKILKKQNTLNNIEQAIKLADIVTVSTEQILNFYSYLNKTIIIIPNAWNDYNYPFKKIEQQKKLIQWRGSQTHRQDLLSCAKDIFDIAEKYSEWAWSFFGNDVWYMTDKIKNVFQMDEKDIIEYNRYLSNVHPAVWMVPLVSNDFNACKSNLAWIEATYAGAACLAPDIEYHDVKAQFDRPGVALYNTQNPESFKYQFEKLLNNESYRKDCYEQSFKYITEHLLLSHVNEKRLSIIGELTNKIHLIK